MIIILRVLCITIVGLCGVLSVDPETTFSKGSMKFAADLNNALAVGSTGKSFVFSPFSVQISAGMLYTGAAGATAEEMAKSLQISNNDRNEVANNFQAMLESHKDEQLEIANKIYIAKGQNVESEFHQIVAEKFDSTEEIIDFADKTHAEHTINNWVKNVTHDKIPDIVNSDTFNNSTLLLMLNAIYFKGAWVNPFPPAHVGEFTTFDKQVKRIEIMSILKYFKLGNLPDLDADVLEMDYKDSNISMMILLPKTEDGLTALEQKLHTVSLLQISEKLKDKEMVDVRIPKFRIEYSVDLRESFETLGMARIFSDGADFSKMISAARVKVGKALHKTFIDVNESGTEAAAVTVNNIRLRTIWPKFYAQHPFIFVIKSKSSILFLGRFLG